jgi:amidase
MQLGSLRKTRRQSRMLRRLERDELREYATAAGFSLEDDEIDQFVSLANGIAEIMDAFVDEPFPEPINVKAERGGVRRSTPKDDPLNAVINWCSVLPEAEGALSGKRIGLKDNMPLAGVPMTYASRILEEHVPEEDCLLAQRILGAGGEIIAKLNMDNFAWSGGGETSDFGPTLNPFDLARTAGGSSSGSAAVLAYEGIDMTFGTDQAGSIRLPASWCGFLGLKPTHGLVPYTGIAPIDPSYDHVGPLARTVDDLALALSVVAGQHELGWDPRQCDIPTIDYRAAVARAPESLGGVVVGVVEEGFDHDGPDAPPGTKETADATRAVVDELAGLGAKVVKVSVPHHPWGAGLLFAACAEGQAATLLSYGNGYHWSGRYAPDLSLALGKALSKRGSELPPSLKNVVLLGTYFRLHYFSSLYAKAQNLRPILREAYDRVLAEVDVIVMPTATHYAHIYKPDATLSERVLRGDSMIKNTAVFDATGHPALSIPAAEADGLPVGVMLVGRRFADDQLLSLAKTWETQIGWRPKARSGRQPHVNGREDSWVWPETR